MNFSNNLIDTIKKCVVIVSLSILINSMPSNWFKIECVIKQGDITSPY